MPNWTSDIISECWLYNLSLACCKKFAHIFIALCYLDGWRLLSWNYSCTTNTKPKVDIWGYQFAVKIPKQGMVKAEPLRSEKEAVKSAASTYEPQTTVSLPRWSVKILCSASSSQKLFKQGAHVTLHSPLQGCSVHIWLGFRSKLDSVKFWFAFGYRRHLDQTAPALLKYTQKATWMWLVRLWFFYYYF